MTAYITKDNILVTEATVEAYKAIVLSVPLIIPSINVINLNITVKLACSYSILSVVRRLAKIRRKKRGLKEIKSGRIQYHFPLNWEKRNFL